MQILGLQGVDPNKFAAFNVLEDEELRQGMRARDMIGVLELLSICVEGVRRLVLEHANGRCAGIKEYSDWPTIPQLYVDKEFVGGTDIMMSMHQDGSLAKVLEEKGVLVPAESSDSSS